MIVKLENESLRVAVESRGGEIQSLKRKDSELEYLWQGCPDTYAQKAINIFPYVARLTGGCYRLGGTIYQMPQHGFVSRMEMECELNETGKAIFRLKSSEETRRMYPWDFVYRIIYELWGNTVKITFSVENMGGSRMYFGLGGHPGFNVPLEAGTGFEMYYLEFSDKCNPIRIGMSKDCFVTGEDKKWELEDDRILKLSHTLFDHDAVILKNMSHEVTLRSDSGERRVTVRYPDMDYLGIWHWPKTTSSYLCIEPWTSLPSRKNIVEDLERQENLCRLGGHEQYFNTWEITLW